MTADPIPHLSAGRPLGALTIGQSPRPDLLAPLLRATRGYRWLEAGALDGVAAAGHAAAVAGTPLRTRLRDGTLITLGERALAPLVQEALARLEAGGAALTLLLCAGTFADLQPAASILLHPFRLALSTLRAAGCRRPLLWVPIPGQIQPTVARYRAAGFSAAAWAPPPTAGAPPADTALTAALTAHRADALLVDYVGHPPATLAALRRATDRPFFALDTLLLGALERQLPGVSP